MMNPCKQDVRARMFVLLPCNADVLHIMYARFVCGSAAASVTVLFVTVRKFVASINICRILAVGVTHNHKTAQSHRNQEALLILLSKSKRDSQFKGLC